MPLTTHDDRHYSVEPYDSVWAKQFVQIKKFLNGLLVERVAEIYHVGSTAIPMMAAKPVIDVLAIVDSLDGFDKFKTALKAEGYSVLKNFVWDNSLLAAKEVNGVRLENIHILSVAHPHVGQMLDAKRFFLVHPTVVAEYSALKLELANQYPSDYAVYRKSKNEYLADLNKRLIQPWCHDNPPANTSS